MGRYRIEGSLAALLCFGARKRAPAPKVMPHHRPRDAAKQPTEVKPKRTPCVVLSFAHKCAAFHPWPRILVRYTTKAKNNASKRMDGRSHDFKFRGKVLVSKNLLAKSKKAQSWHQYIFSS
mmetsp:Transcript_32948/g.68636  ORF Transcript_32948/g.68636 Transcript_32948/m.68636 type:complete len:121 (-) Transcript_32948:75-437(-)